MKTKKTLAIILLLTMLLAVLSACGESKPKEGQQQEQAQENAQTNEKELDADSAVDYVINDCGISVAYLSEIKVSNPDEKTIKVTFKYNNEEGLYLFDKATGEVLEKNVPKASNDNSSSDPFQDALNAAFDSLEGYKGGAENIKVSSSGNIITVKFEWNGEKYEFRYDINTKKIVD